MFLQSVNHHFINDLRTHPQPAPITRLPLQRTFRIPRTDSDLLTLNPGRKSFTMLFEGDKLPVQGGVSQIVTVASVDEAASFLLLLGESCEIFISTDFRREHPEVYAEAKMLSYPGLRKEPPFNIETAAVLMKKLPLDLKGLMKSSLAIMPEGRVPERIDKKFVHKKNTSNVLISKVYSSGWLHYFNMFNETEELKFDHTSDHVQGMLMLEALRQAALATAHIQGLSFDGGLALLNYDTNFFHYLESSAPIILRAYCSFTANETSEDKDAPIYIQVMQWGKVCADARLKAFAFMSSQRYEQQKKRIEIISSRSKVQFQAKAGRILEAGASV